MNAVAINSMNICCINYNTLLSKFKVKMQLLLFLAFFFFGSFLSFGQCPDHTSNICDGQRVTVDVDTLPFCDEGGTGIEGDISQNLDCEDINGLNCFEFQFFRQSGSATESFTFDVGQGQGCTGELDASYFVYDGTSCQPLSSGGSQTNIPFDFPSGINEIYIYLCINSNAQVTMCDVCRERPPCTVDVACQQLEDITGNYCAGDPCELPAPTTVISEVFAQNELCDFEVIMESSDSGETNCIDGNGNNQIEVVRTYTLKYFDLGANDFITIQTCQQNIILSEENCCVLPNLTTEDSSVCGESQTSIDLSTLVTSGGTISYHSSQLDADNNDNPINDTNVSPLVQTTYYVRSEVAADCYVTDTVTISINPLPDASATGGEINCFNGGSLQLTGSSNTPGVTYSWSGPGGYSSVEQNPFVSQEAGIYTLTVTETQTGCTATATAEVNVDISSITISAGPDQELTCATTEVTLDGSGSSNNPDADVSFSWFGPNGFTADTEDITVSAIGTYTLTVTDNDNGCFATGSAEVTADETTPTADAGADAELTCRTLEVTLDGSGSSTNPDADLSYSWSGPGGFSAATEDITVSAIGTYTLTVTDNDNGCSAMSDVNVTKEVIELIITKTDVTCFGLDDGTITVNFVTDGATVTVNGLPYNADMLYEPGTYTVVAYFEGNDDEDCLISEDITIVEPVFVDVQVSSTDATCYGANDGTITIESLSEGAFYTIKLNGVGPDLSNQDFFAPGTYVVEAKLIANQLSRNSSVSEVSKRSQNPCVDAKLVVIGQPNMLTCRLGKLYDGNEIRCGDRTNNNLTVNHLGGTGPYTYSWSMDKFGYYGMWQIESGEQAQTMTYIPGLGHTTFTVEVTDANGCTTTCEIKLESTCTKEDYYNNVFRKAEFDFEMYPNPTKGNLTITPNRVTDNSAVVELYDLVGTRIINQSFSNLNDNKININLSNLASQVYYLKVITRDGTKIKKVVLDK